MVENINPSMSIIAHPILYLNLDNKIFSRRKPTSRISPPLQEIPGGAANTVKQKATDVVTTHKTQHWKILFVKDNAVLPPGDAGFHVFKTFDIASPTYPLLLNRWLSTERRFKNVQGVESLHFEPGIKSRHRLDEHHHVQVYPRSSDRCGDGGYYPVQFGEILRGENATYKVYTRRGYGRDGEVFLVENLRTSQCHVVKIFKSGLSVQARQQADVLKKLSAGPSNDPGKKHIVDLLDSFEISGPSGHHTCLVTQSLRDRPSHIHLESRNDIYLCKQLVEAVVYMHKLGVTHGGPKIGKHDLSRYLPKEAEDRAAIVAEDASYIDEDEYSWDDDDEDSCDAEAEDSLDAKDEDSHDAENEDNCDSKDENSCDEDDDDNHVYDYMEARKIKRT
ncbi:uncharacterized protein KY384_008826 [Bacidia gigantensis]|uniref:uncharacterized protein n=1 Tax=Bacidia gigantensis TaxID=2732470 RepID=UPI001D055A2B|nr:uncharacterized protein KY384_008826 [Bacidia gigantensis]KAG8526625.1 hypothetical protein KY384_008826 [Bacidia gigantensis]